jgi:hypothetical protein
VKKRRADAASPHVDCKEQVFLPGGHAASPYCRFVWRLTIIR